MADNYNQKLILHNRTVFDDSHLNAEMSVDYDSLVENAKSFLLFRDFSSCHRACLSGISTVKSSLDTNRSDVCIERLCLLCIQALAEMDRWQAVLPMVQTVYDSIDACPATVIQMCLLLHAQVEEFSQCHAIASIWLRNKDNLHQPDYTKVVSLYVVKVMIPQKQMVLVPQIMNSCTHLSESVKSKLIEDFHNISSDLENSVQRPSENVEKTDTDTQEANSRTSSPAADNKINDVSLFSYMKYFASVLMNKLSFPALDILWKVAAVAIGLAVLCKVAIDGELLYRLNEATKLWKNVLAVFKTMFTPYTPGK